MSWVDALRDAFTFFVALVTIVGVATGIGFWVGKLTTRQSQTETELSDLKSEVQQMRRARESSIEERLKNSEAQLSDLLE